jgi:NAD(P)-dependent dehydrogenase (short-subunit alcohol dehydrogenase family)
MLEHPDAKTICSKAVVSFAVCSSLSSSSSSSISFISGDVLTLLPRWTDLTARDKGRGEAAIKDLEQDVQLKKAKSLKADGGLTEIKFHSFDVTDSGSIETFADHLKKTYPDGVDFVINNAGIAMDGFGG